MSRKSEKTLLIPFSIIFYGLGIDTNQWVLSNLGVVLRRLNLMAIGIPSAIIFLKLYSAEPLEHILGW